MNQNCCWKIQISYWMYR